jgi:FixJ family two-component response regulator
MMMPKMGGRELADKLKKVLPRLKVILMSGHPEDARSPLSGFHFLQKPFSMLSLAGAVREVLDK